MSSSRSEDTDGIGSKQSKSKRIFLDQSSYPRPVRIKNESFWAGVHGIVRLHNHLGRNETVKIRKKESPISDNSEDQVLNINSLYGLNCLYCNHDENTEHSLLRLNMLLATNMKSIDSFQLWSLLRQYHSHLISFVRDVRDVALFLHSLFSDILSLLLSAASYYSKTFIFILYFIFRLFFYSLKNQITDFYRIVFNIYIWI